MGERQDGSQPEGNKLVHVLEPAPFSRVQEDRLSTSGAKNNHYVLGATGMHNWQQNQNRLLPMPLIQGYQPAAPFQIAQQWNEATAYPYNSVVPPNFAANENIPSIVPSVAPFMYNGVSFYQNSIMREAPAERQDTPKEQVVRNDYLGPGESSFSNADYHQKLKSPIESDNQASLKQRIYKNVAEYKRQSSNTTEQVANAVTNDGISDEPNSTDASYSDIAGHMSDSVVYHSDGGGSSEQNSVGSGSNSLDAPFPSRRRDHIDWNTLKNHFHLPMNEASARLGVCVTVLKKICRRFGISRWPHRKLKSVARHIEKQERAFSKAPGVENLSYDEVLDLCRKRPHKKMKLESDQESTKSEGDVPSIMVDFSASSKDRKQEPINASFKETYRGIDIIAESSVLVPASQCGVKDLYNDLEHRLKLFTKNTNDVQFYVVWEWMNRIFDFFTIQMSLSVFEPLCTVLKAGMWTCDSYGNHVAEKVGIEHIPQCDLPFSLSTFVMDTPFLRLFESQDNSSLSSERCFQLLESSETGILYAVGKYYYGSYVKKENSDPRTSRDSPVVLWSIIQLNGSIRE
eukprot:jgi/Galph1/2138/GphlegSOOS_G776.1